MTNKEAIAILKPLFEQCKGTNECLGYIEHYFSKDEELALDLAIKALEEVEERNKLKLICAVDNRIVGSLDTGDCPTILKPKQIER